MTKPTMSSRFICRSCVGTALLMGAVLASGEARADYNIKATEAAQSTFVEDSKCNLVEAVDSLNHNKIIAGSGLHGCVNVGGGKRIVLEGTGAHYNVGTGIVIALMDAVDITSKISGRDFIEGAAIGRLITVQFGTTLTLTGLTIQRTGTSFARVLENYGTLFVTNSVVQNGNTQNDGGGIYNGGDLRLSGSTVRNNKANRNGGGIFSTGWYGVTANLTTVSNNTSSLRGGGIYGSDSPLTLIQGTVSNNKSSVDGGGIFNSNGSVYMDRVTIQANTAVKNGGGIYHALGTLQMRLGRVTGAHTAVEGGGIYNEGGVAQFNGATIEGASATGDGGGIYNGGDLLLYDTTVQSNKATGNGGGVYSMSSIGMSFDGSTISNNTASLNGGGIYSSSRCQGIRSTISTNTAQGNGGGVYSTVGDQEYLELGFVTVGYNKGASGAGVYIDGHANTQTRSSIVAKNQLPNGTFEDYRGNPHARDLDYPSAYRSVFGTTSGTTNVFPGPNGDIVGASNILPLANNGGPTRTHEIPANSSALNKLVIVPDAAWPCPATDQRGRPRPVGGACDLGSYERQ